MKELCLDTANQTLGVAFLEEEKPQWIVQRFQQKNHSIALMPAIEDGMKELQWEPKDLDRIYVSYGPGSYTGVRIGVTTAKTIAYALQCPLRLVSSLAIMAASAPKGIVVPMINARRQHVYAGIYEWDGEKVVSLHEDGYFSLEEMIDRASAFEEVIFTGDAKDFKEEILAQIPEAKIQEGWIDSAPNPYGMIFCPYEEVSGEAIHTVVPNYLKRVEAEENWLKEHGTQTEETNYVERTK